MQEPITLKTSFWNRLDDDEFFHFCQEHKNWVIERDHEGTIYIMSPTGSESGHYESILNGELYRWNFVGKKGFTFSSSTGFLFADSSVFSPDAAFVGRERWNALSPAERKQFAPIAPDFVAEIRSSSDNIAQLHEKMSRYLLNGVRLAWLIDPIQEKAWVYAPDQEVEEITGFDQTLGGGEVLPGFEFPLSLLK